MKDEKAVKEVVKALGGPMLEEVEPGQYSFMSEFYVGVKDGTFYLSTPSPVLSMAKPRKAAEADEGQALLWLYPYSRTDEQRDGQASIDEWLQRCAH